MLTLSISKNLIETGKNEKEEIIRDSLNILSKCKRFIDWKYEITIKKNYLNQCCTIRSVSLKDKRFDKKDQPKQRYVLSFIPPSPPTNKKNHFTITIISF